METTAISKIFVNRRRVAWVLTNLVLLIGMLNVLQDLIRSDLKNSSYYLSESVLFSSFWWLFAPLLWGQFALAKKVSTHLRLPVLVLLPIVIHLLAYPALVWILSGAFYYHTFAFQQTLGYTLSAYLILLILFYPVSFLIQEKTAGSSSTATVPGLQQHDQVPENYIKTLLISEGSKKRPVEVSDVFFISARPPYIAIHLTGRQYLVNETLKSVSAKLDPNQFVRVHKSVIVNIHKVSTYVSRNNGDYDVTLHDETQLRISRNFSARFKQQYNLVHRFTTK